MSGGTSDCRCSPASASCPKRKRRNGLTLSKIYEALKKSEQERERTRVSARPRPVALSGGPEPVDAAHEDYQRLRANLVSIAVPSGLHTILVTAPRHGEGATTVAVGLASALAKERDARVL